MTTRRNFFAISGAAVAAGALAGCGTLTGSQLVTDAEAVANAVSSMATTLESVVPATSLDVLKNIEDAAVLAGKDATALASLIPNSTATTTTLIAGIVSAVTTYDAIIPTFFPASAPIVLVLNAALIIAQGLYAAAGITPPATANLKTPVVAMPVSTARALLSRSPVHSRGADRR